MESRIKCRTCERMILEVTAKANEGFCGQCAKHERRKAFDAIVATWLADPSKIPGTNGIPMPENIALSIKARELRHLLTPEGQRDRRCDEFFDKAHTKWMRKGAGALNDLEKHILAVETFFGEVSNGGIVQFLGNESHAFANWAPKGFEQIGIPEYAEVARKVVALFPNNSVPEDADECWDITCKLDEAVVKEIEKSFYALHDKVRATFKSRIYDYISRGNEGVAEGVRP